MSEDGEIDVESDGLPDGYEGGPLDKRAHHNALERKRRDHIKDSFHNLRDCIPSLTGEKVSRAHILNKATEYIRQMQRGSAQRLGEIDDLKKKNELLEEQLQVVEQMQAVDNGDSMEDLLQAVAERVQQRQAVRQQQQSAKPAMKLDQDSLRTEQVKANSTLSQLPAGKDGKLAAASINLLATQTLINALSKTQPGKTLAARVLASPLRPQTSVVGGSPRGIVTATTVANWGSSPSSTPQPIRPLTPLMATSVSQSVDNPLTVLAGTAVSSTPTNSSQLDSSEERATQTGVGGGRGSEEGGEPPIKRSKTDL